MPQHATLVNADEIFNVVRSAAPTTIGNANIDMSFDDMEVDSLSLVELSVVISEKYGIFFQDWEMKQAGNFEKVAEIVNTHLASKALN